jgi:GMP synthase PP-ATPase subunit
MTARWAELPHDLLARTSSRIINEIAGISRVLRHLRQAAGDDRVGVI